MKALTHRKKIITLMLVVALMMSGINVSAASSKVSLKKYNYPKTMTQGSSFVIKGKISSSKTIKRVEIGVVSSKNKWTAQKYDNKKVNAKSFNVKKADSKIKFGKLKAGTYYYRIYAHTGDKKVHTLLNKKFTVKKKVTAPKTTTVVVSDVKLKMTGCNAPSKYAVGKDLKVKGTVTADANIKKVEIGIVYEPTNAWTEYKYTKNVGSKSFNIADAASKLRFDLLPGGTYRYRMYAHTDKGLAIVFDKSFTVTPSKKPAKAVAWAKKIANDDTFTYGKSPQTNTTGCYFCGTTKRTKPKGYEKTYVCLTFLGAAYAHGAKDPEILAKCKKGKMTVYSNNDNFNMFSCWMKMGTCKKMKFESLQPGDVIVEWSSDNGNGHVWMYIGGDSYVDAAYPGWGKGTIAVRSGAQKYFNYEKTEDSRNYVMRYRY